MKTKTDRLVSTKKEMEAYERHIKAVSVPLKPGQLNELKCFSAIRGGKSIGHL